MLIGLSILVKMGIWNKVHIKNLFKTNKVDIVNFGIISYKKKNMNDF